MVFKSYAKINLSLSVNKKLKNGYHDIQSIYCLVNLHDTINISKIKSKKFDKIYFKGPFSKNVFKSNNSIKKVLDFLRKYKLISNYFKIKVNKKIPVFAGLGGGSSNAFTLLKFIKQKKIKKEILNKLINLVGTDLRLFFNKQGYLRNLKKVEKLSKNHKLYFMIVYPNIKCSTEKIYSKIKKYSKKRKFPAKNLKSKKKFINQILNLNNDLQLIVEKKYPLIRKLLFNISKQRDCYLARMTGSGSACFGLFSNENSSKVALKKMRKKYPKFWFSIAKTV
tara:strand:- start:75 stop:914 length:840 start_codon:yes stop_codon:yes gene_type:complete